MRHIVWVGVAFLLSLHEVNSARVYMAPGPIDSVKTCVIIDR